MITQEQTQQSGTARGNLAVDFNRRVPMRDGARLNTDVYRPAEGAHPVILIRTPYTKSLSLSCLAQYLAKRQFAVVVQSQRGRYGSTGTFNPLTPEDEERDGYDTLRWLSQESWSNGHIGLLGWSYSVLSNYTLLGIDPPAGVKIQAAVSCMEVVDPYKAVYSNGALLLHWALQWAFLIEGTNDRALKPYFVVEGQRIGWPEIFNMLPLMSVPDQLAVELPKFKQWLEHPTYDKFWKQGNMEKTAAESRVPTLHISGWFDFCLEATVSAYERGRALSPNHAMILGPWDHGSVFDEILRGVLPQEKTRPEPYGIAARYPLFEAMIEWFDCWLRDKPNAGNRKSQIHFFVKHEDQWQTELQWPPPDIKWTKLYLESGRRLVIDHPPQKGKESYLYDPFDPAPTLGGAVYHVPKLVKPGATDQQELCNRTDIITYTTGTVMEDFSIIGLIKVNLFFSTTAPDTDFTVKLTDIHPDGFVEIIQDGIMRARYLESFLKARLLTPCVIYRTRFDLGNTAHLVRKGHSLGVMVSSSNFPKYDRNPNTGRLIAQESEPDKTQQTIYSGAVYASFIQIPVRIRSGNGRLQFKGPRAGISHHMEANSE